MRYKLTSNSLPVWISNHDTMQGAYSETGYLVMSNAPCTPEYGTKPLLLWVPGTPWAIVHTHLAASKMPWALLAFP